MLPSRLCGGLGAAVSLLDLILGISPAQELGFNCRIQSHAGVPPKNWRVALDPRSAFETEPKCLRAVV